MEHHTDIMCIGESDPGCDPEDTIQFKVTLKWVPSIKTQKINLEAKTETYEFEVYGGPQVNYMWARIRQELKNHGKDNNVTYWIDQVIVSSDKNGELVYDARFIGIVKDEFNVRKYRLKDDKHIHIIAHEWND